MSRSRPSEARSRKTTSIAWRIDDPGWRGVELPVLRKAARTALAEAGQTGALTVLLTSDDRLRELNEKFRGKPKPTNVLSFPAASAESGYLGDIAVAFGVAEGEAEAAGKALSGHAAHLVVHGILHLLGYDHEFARDARIMESLEVAILKRVGVGDPYAGALAAE
ncbi:MAG: rRNA maturation RNase YbeY [Rhizomicrobium sp.]|jgi:probable rRNA maturation factor